MQPIERWDNNMEFLGYIIAIILAVLLVLLGYLLVLTIWRKQAVKGISVAPWKAHIEFYNIDDKDKDQDGYIQL